MKKQFIKYISFVVSGVLMLSSCDDITEENNTTTASFENIEQLVQGRLPSLYASLRSNAIYASSGIVNTWGDVGVDTHSGTLFPAEYNPLYGYQYGPGTALISETWVEMYAAIKQINFFLGQVTNLPGDNGDKNVARAEARFLRGLLYFDLVKIWGNVPIILDEGETLVDVDEEAVVANSPSEDVYLQIINDLRFAESNLLTRSVVGSSDIASKEAAQALLGKVYLQMTTPKNFGGVEGGIDSNGNVVSVMARFSQAANQFKSVIESGAFALEDNYSDVFNPDNESDNRETIFVVGFDGPNNEVGGDWGDFVGPIGDNKDGGAFGAYRINLDTAFEYLVKDGLVDPDNVVDPNGSPANLLPRPNTDFFEGFSNFRGQLRILGPENFISDSRFEHNVARFNAVTVARAIRGESITEQNLFNSTHTNIDAWSPFKWHKPLPNPNDAGDGSIDFPYLRYADVLLMYAEALNALGDSMSAVDQVNLVIERSLKDHVQKDIPVFVNPEADIKENIIYRTPTPDNSQLPTQNDISEILENNQDVVDKEAFKIDGTGLSSNEVLDLILRERLLELCFEGKRKDDLLRTGKIQEIIDGLHLNSVNSSLANQEAIKASFDLSKHTHWPIPQREIILNNNLKQNCAFGSSAAGCFE